MREGRTYGIVARWRLAEYLKGRETVLAGTLAMEDLLHERDKAYEAKYKLDEELQFKAKSRRNKLLGQWAAESMGMSQGESEAYAREVVVSDFAARGDGGVIAKVMADLRKRGVAATEEEIAARLGEFGRDALEQLRDQYPEALGPDHERVGG